MAWVGTALTFLGLWPRGDAYGLSSWGFDDRQEIKFLSYVALFT
jgi:hypothetical protein